jgi:hypothetical protein
LSDLLKSLRAKLSVIYDPEASIMHELAQVAATAGATGDIDREADIRIAVARKTATEQYEARVEWLVGLIKANHKFDWPHTSAFDDGGIAYHEAKRRIAAPSAQPAGGEMRSVPPLIIKLIQNYGGLRAEKVACGAALAQIVVELDAWGNASQPAAAASIAAVRDALTPAEVDEVWNSMPGGPGGWLEQFGYSQFARGIEEKLRALKSQPADPAAPQGEA